MLLTSRRVIALFVGVASVVAVTAPAHATTEPAASVEGDVVVFAAASLTDAFTAIGDAFECRAPDADVTFNFAASSDLVTQINEGAPADVFASADQRNMDKLVDAERAAADPATFATQPAGDHRRSRATRTASRRLPTSPTPTSSW